MTKNTCIILEYIKFYTSAAKKQKQLLKQPKLNESEFLSLFHAMEELNCMQMQLSLIEKHEYLVQSLMDSIDTLPSISENLIHSLDQKMKKSFPFLNDSEFPNS